MEAETGALSAADLAGVTEAGIDRLVGLGILVARNGERPFVNLAARIAARAGAGQVLVSERVAESASPTGVRFLALGELRLKGIAQPVRVLEARGA